MADVPLQEASEAYRLDILQGAVLRRRVVLPAPTYRYYAALQVADLGGLTPFTVRISQMSAAVGPGAALTEVVDV
jgi:hypothetical protein